MPRLIVVIAALAALLGSFAYAEAGIVVAIDKSAQQLTVTVNGFTRYQWPVSTARWGYRTPNGTYRPQWLARKWFSTIYDGSPMPYSIFFNGGYAIHGSYEIRRLGRPASHGCIRLHPENAAVLFELVKANMRDTQIVVSGETPAPQARSRRKRDGGRYESDRGVSRYESDRGTPRETQPQFRGFQDIFNPSPRDESVR